MTRATEIARRTRAAHAVAIMVSCAAIQCTPDSTREQQAAALPASVTTCQSCHAQVVSSFVRTGHFNTSANASPHTVQGHFETGRNRLDTHIPGVYFVMSDRPEGMYQTGVDSTRGQAMSQRIDIAVGSGRRGQPFLYWSHRLLYQLPVSYLTATDNWINSPGYQDGTVDFGRLIVPRCLECHSESFQVQRVGNGFVYGRSYELGITCAKCHGDGQAHATFAATHPADTAGAVQRILNPARFTRDRRMDNCALCHSGNPPTLGVPFTYQPGDDLSKYLAADKSTPVPDVHGNQVGLLRLSKCYRNSPDMSCSTCHNVHEVQRDVTAMAQNCLKCHQVAKHPNAERIGDRMMSQCVNCHMPVSVSNALQINTPNATGGFSLRSHRIAVYQDVAARLLR